LYELCDRAKVTETQRKLNHYTLLGLHPWASAVEIRQAYRELCKRYHPDTTELPVEIAKAKFHQLNDAYAILSNPERRARYNLQIGFSPIRVMQTNSPHHGRSSAYLDPTDRPLSPGEIFALLLLGVVLLACLTVAIAIGLTRETPMQLS